MFSLSWNSSIYRSGFCYDGSQFLDNTQILVSGQSSGVTSVLLPIITFSVPVLFAAFHSALGQSPDISQGLYETSSLCRS